MYGGFNTPNAMRMLQSLYAAHQPAPEPPAPVKASRPRKARPPTPSVTSEESESDSYSSASSDYEDTDVIYHHVTEKAKCPRVSPAGLKSHSGSRKEAVTYLKKKECPEVPNLKKGKKAEAPAPEPKVVLAEPEKAVVPKTRRVSRKVKKSEPAAPAKVEAPAAPVGAAAPAAPAAGEKKKRAPSAYNTFVAEQRKAGKSMAEAAAAWKAKKGQ